MLASIVGFALRQRVLIAALALLLVVFGVQTSTRIPLDVFPEFAPPRVEIQTEAPGLSTEEVESLITVPLENALNGVAWVKTLRSKSVLGLSSVLCIFEEGTDVIRARQLIQERVAAIAPRLPSVARPPVILQPLSSTSRAMKIGVSSKTLSQMELSDLALWTIRPRLMGIRGVANVAIWGQRDREFQVLVDPDRLAANGVTLDQVVKAAGDATVVSGGGFVDTPNQRLPVQHLTELYTPDDLARTVVRFEGGAPIRLGDIADVVVGHPAPIGDAVINDGPGLLLIVEKQPWGNTLEVTKKVEAALDALKPGIKGVDVDPTIFRPATFIERSLGNLTQALLIGSILVVVVLFFFTLDWRSAVISLTAIPLSLLAAGLVLYFQGGTLNTMVIAGLIIALGEIVDDAIIDVENIRRRLGLNAAEAHPKPALNVVLAASLEVRSAVVFAGMIVAMVFVPVLFLEGLAGTFFRPLAMAYLLAIAASLLVALTVTPALCLMLMPGEPLARREPLLVRGLKGAYEAILPGFVRRPRTSLVALAILIAGAGMTGIVLKEQFLPNFRETDFLMHWVEKPGTSLEAMTRITVSASKELRAIPGVRNFGSHIGRAEVADEVVGPNFTELWISLDEKAPYDATLKRIQDVVDGYPGLYRDVLTYLRERIKEVLTGASASIVVRIFGADVAVLRGEAEQVRAAIAGVDGVSNLHVEQQVLVPQIQVRLRPEIAANFGLTSADVRRAATTFVQGERVGQIYHDQRVLNVAVWGVERVRHDVEALRQLPIETPTGARVPLGDVADVVIMPTPNEIKREGGSRRIDVTLNVKDGSDLGSVAREVKARVQKLTFSRGDHPEFLGEYQALQDSRTRLLSLSVLSMLGVLLLLYVEFQSARLMLLIAASLPFALIGGVAGVVMSGGILSLGSLVGFVTVLGIAARNGIMLISHYRHLEREEGMPFGPALIMRGATERLAPILMTASCASLALLPIVLAANAPGHEIEAPMAAVILGGLVTSTLLTLVLLPTLYAAFGRSAAANG
ncbi:MAG: efflux RND transporter permease subunit [Alphaproteobacteria bacterium]|nr:efflux RND transporter permease subunit [Alphaproteobacteria bacterium]